mgnify:CR=1 FL=1
MTDIARPRRTNGQFGEHQYADPDIELDDDDDDVSEQLFVFERGDKSYDVLEDGDGHFSIYETDGGFVVSFQYHGDPEDHSEVEDAATDALDDAGL